MKVTIGSFGGIIPRLSPHALGNTNASIADSVKLRNGRLEAWRKPCEFPVDNPISGAMSFHLHGCCPVLWAEQGVTAAEVHPDWGRFYITERTNRLETVLVDGTTCAATTYYTGVPSPSSAPFVSSVEECSRIADSRSYVYTYINLWGEESAPSPASSVIRVNDGSPVRVSGIELPPEGYGIVGANVYRATTGYQHADGKLQKPLTDFLFVAYVQFPAVSFSDTVKLVALGPALETQKTRVPPVGLQNVCKISDKIRLAGTTTNMVHFSEPFQLHNWPVQYDLTLRSNIVHMRCVSGYLIVTTDTNPYVIDARNMDMSKPVPVSAVDMQLPDIACVSSSSAIATPFGLIYSSPLGATLVDTQGRWRILTADWFSEDDWHHVRPETARFAFWEGYLFITTDVITLLLDINGDPFGDMRGAELVTLNRYMGDSMPVMYETGGTGDCLYLQEGVIRVWNKDAEYAPFFWRSRDLTGDNDAGGAGNNADRTAPQGNLWSPTSAKIQSALTEFTLLSEGKILYHRNVAGSKPFRLPRMGRHRSFNIQLEGTETIEYADMGTSYFTVNAGV